jgi:hypothetical protein
MIHYLYHLDYPQTTELPTVEAPAEPEELTAEELSAGERRAEEWAMDAPAEPLEKPSNLTLHVRLYALGELYVVEGL